MALGIEGRRVTIARQAFSPEEMRYKRHHESGRVRHSRNFWAILAIFAILLSFTIVVSMYAVEDKRLPGAVGLIVLMLIVLPFLVRSFRQTLSVNISPRGITLVKRGIDKLIPFSKVRRVAPTMHVEISSWSAERSTALEIVTDRRMVLRVPEDDVRAISHIWRGMSGRSRMEEGQAITQAVRQLERKVFRGRRLLAGTLIVVIALTTVLMLLLLPDVNIRGEEMTPGTKVLGAVAMALLFAFFIVLMYALTVNPLYSAELQGLIIWAADSGAHFRSKRDTPLGNRRIARMLGENYLYGGWFVSAMGALLSVFGVIELVTSSLLGSGMMFILAGIGAIAIGSGFSLKGWFMVRVARRKR